MAERIASIVLLVEDLRQESLLRHYFKRLGHDSRSFRIQMIAHGQGSGEQFVREKYASEVRAIRQQLSRTKACLAVMIDADSDRADALRRRRQQLERALQDADEAPRGASEPILNLIPKLNVETWILALTDLDVDEGQDYRHDPRVDAPRIKQAAATLHTWTRRNAVLPDLCTPSLRDCLPEFRRVPGDE
jgi:hypothetical protein